MNLTDLIILGIVGVCLMAIWEWISERRAKAASDRMPLDATIESLTTGLEEMKRARDLGWTVGQWNAAQSAKGKEVSD